MGASAGVNLEPQARNPSFLVCEPEPDDSDFEFDLSDTSSNELPASPKLLSFSPQWGIAASISMLMPTTSSFTEDHVYTAAPDIHHLYARDIVSQGGAVADSDTITSPQYKHYNFNGRGHQEESCALRSLMLQSREWELEQLSQPLVSCHRSKGAAAERENDDDHIILRSSSSDVASLSNSPSLSSESASSSPQHQKKKSKRWPFRMDFLHSKKASNSAKALDQDHAFHYALVRSDQLRDTNYHDAAEISDRNVESPSGRPTGNSLISSVSSSGSAILPANQTGTRKSPAASPSRATPSISPAQSRGDGSPPSSPVTRRPMSPHAQHYQQQRARAQELQRRTFLPYRHSLLGACFFPSPSPRPQLVAY